MHSMIQLESLFLWSSLMYVDLVTMYWFTFRTCASIILESRCFFNEYGQLESPGVMFWGSGLSFGVGGGLWHWNERTDGREWRTQRKDTQKWIEAGVFTSLFWKSLPVCVPPECECVSVGGVEVLPGNSEVHMWQLLSFQDFKTF